MLVRIRIVEERSLWRAVFLPDLEVRLFFERRQIVTTTRYHHLLDRRGLRQIDKKALGRFLVLGEVPCGPEIGKERRKPAFRSRREAMRPALFGDLWCVALGDGPGA